MAALPLPAWLLPLSPASGCAKGLTTVIYDQNFNFSTPASSHVRFHSMSIPLLPLSGKRIPVPQSPWHHCPNHNPLPSGTHYHLSLRHTTFWRRQRQPCRHLLLSLAGSFFFSCRQLSIGDPFRIQGVATAIMAVHTSSPYLSAPTAVVSIVSTGTNQPSGRTFLDLKSLSFRITWLDSPHPRRALWPSSCFAGF